MGRAPAAYVGTVPHVGDAALSDNSAGEGSANAGTAIARKAAKDQMAIILIWIVEERLLTGYIMNKRSNKRAK